MNLKHWTRSNSLLLYGLAFLALFISLTIVFLARSIGRPIRPHNLISDKDMSAICTQIPQVAEPSEQIGFFAVGDYPFLALSIRARLNEDNPHVVPNGSGWAKIQLENIRSVVRLSTNVVPDFVKLAWFDLPPIRSSDEIWLQGDSESPSSVMVFRPPRDLYSVRFIPNFLDCPAHWRQTLSKYQLGSSFPSQGQMYEGSLEK